MERGFVINIFTHQREDNFWRVLNYIDQNHPYMDKCCGIFIFKDGEEVKYSDEFYDLEETHDLVELTVSKENRGIGYQKETARQFSSDPHNKNQGCHTFFIEDDCEILSNEVWEECITFSNITGIRHFNWNNYRKQPLGELESCGYGIYVHRDCEASFSFFHGEIIDDFEFDTNYYNALEHADVELQLAKKHILPPFWTFCSPIILDSLLGHLESESTISLKPNYNEVRKNAFEYFKEKWGCNVNEIKPLYFNRAKISLERLKREFGTPIPKKTGRPVKPNPVSIVVTIKDRSCFYYRSPDDLLPMERQRMALDQKEMEIVANLNDGRGGLKYNMEYLQDLNGFRPFDKFLESINKQSDIFKGEVELIVVDWSSKDDDVEELIKCFWIDKKYKYINLEEETFSRGYALNIGIAEATYDRIHVSDIDMKYHNTEFLEDVSTLEEDEVIFPMMLKEMTPSSFKLRFEIASFGMACFHKKLFMKTGGYPDIRKWGKEDIEFAEKCFKLTDKVSRKPWLNAIHTFHTDSHR